MAVTVKSAREIELMREAGRLLEIVHDEMAKIIRPGISTMDINERGDKVIRELGCKPNFLNYGGFPASICVSVNEEVVHGIPRRDHFLKEGDIVSLDAGLIYKGYHSDAARTHAVGTISPEAQKLLDVTKQSFFEGIKQAKAGNHLFDISAAIDDYVSGFGYGIVQDLVGHDKHPDVSVRFPACHRHEESDLLRTHHKYLLFLSVHKPDDRSLRSQRMRGVRPFFLRYFHLVLPRQ